MRLWPLDEALRTPADRPMVTAFVLAMVAGVALAQDVTGTITARLGGVEKTWNTLGFDHPDGYQTTASWSVLTDPFVSISIQGHPGTSPQLEEALAIDLSTFDGFPIDCPCPLQEADVMYWSTSSMFEDVYVGTDADVTLTTVEPLDEGGETLDVEGTFAVESLPRRVVE